MSKKTRLPENRIARTIEKNKPAKGKAERRYNTDSPEKCNYKYSSPEINFTASM